MLSPADMAVIKMTLDPRMGGLNVLTRWFFDTSVLINQYVCHHAPQPNIIHLGGVGSGKTLGVAFSNFGFAFCTPYVEILNTSITSGQAELAFNMLEPRIKGNKKVEPYIEDIVQRPYPTIKFKNGAQITFRTAGYEARNIRGFEYDIINFDEGGYEPRKTTIQYLRGRLRGRRPDGTPRMHRLSITTTPTDVPWLIDMWERGVPDEGDTFDPLHYCSVRSTTYDNKFLTPAQIAEIVRDYPDSMIEQEIYAKFPDYGDTEFSRASIEQCESVLMLDEMEAAMRGPGKKAGWDMIEHPRHGCVYWAIDPEPGRRYVMAGDPGSGSPPKRNSPCVMVFDTTALPYKMVFFHWIDGKGSIMPFLTGYKYAMDTYQPTLCGMDVTGPQKGMEEVAFAEHDINVDRINFQRDKDTMITALKYALSKGTLRFPFIKGLHSQLRSYRRDNDKKLDQDLVATLIQIAHLARFLPTDEVKLGSQGTMTRRDRNYRSRRDRNRRTSRGA